MTVVSGQHYGVGLRYATVFQLNSSGLPLAGGVPAVATEGYEVYGANAWELTIPEVRRINHPGNDRLMAMDFLPPIEAASGVLRGAALDQILAAMLTNVNEWDIGYMNLLPIMTEQQGSEPDVALFLYQQTLDRATKLRRWRFHIIPKAKCTPVTQGMSEANAVMAYNIGMNPTTKHLWGTTLSVNTEGCTELAVVEGMSEGRPKIVAWLADGAENEFDLPSDKPATAANRITVWVDGVLEDGSPTKTVTKVTFGSPPADDAVVVALYEF